MTYYDRLNYFFNFLKLNNLNASTQLTYLHILHHSNCLKGVTSFYLTDTEIANSTNLSIRSITDAKRVLKNFGLLDWRNVGGRTKIFLPQNDNFHRTANDSTESISKASAKSALVSLPNNNYKEKEKRTGASAGGFSEQNRIDIAKIQRNNAEIQKKLNTDSKGNTITEEQREAVRRKMAEFMQSHAF